VAVGVIVGVRVTVGVAEGVSVKVPVWLGVALGVTVSVWVGVALGVAVVTTPALSQPAPQVSALSKVRLAQPAAPQIVPQAVKLETPSTQKAAGQAPLRHTQHIAAARSAQSAPVETADTMRTNASSHARRPLEPRADSSLIMMMISPRSLSTPARPRLPTGLPLFFVRSRLKNE
jgi:hypothetical protein